MERWQRGSDYKETKKCEFDFPFSFQKWNVGNILDSEIKQV